MTDARSSAAFWLSARTLHRLLADKPIVEMSVEDPAIVLDRASGEIRRTMAAFFEEDTPYRDPMLNILIGAEAVRKCKPAQEWSEAIAPLGRAPIPQHMTAAARVFAGNRWMLIDRLARELAHEKRMSVSAVLWLLNLPRKVAA